MGIDLDQKVRDLEATVRTLTAQNAALTERAERAERLSGKVNLRAERLNNEATTILHAAHQMLSLIQDMEDD